MRFFSRLPAGIVICIQSGSAPHGRTVPGLVAGRNGSRQCLDLARTGHVQFMGYLDLLGRVPRHLPGLHVRDVRHGEVAGEGYGIAALHYNNII